MCGRVRLASDYSEIKIRFWRCRFDTHRYALAPTRGSLSWHDCCYSARAGSEETFMNLKLIVAILAIAFVSVCAQAQQPSGAKVKADVQNVVKIISGDK